MTLRPELLRLRIGADVNNSLDEKSICVPTGSFSTAAPTPAAAPSPAPTLLPHTLQQTACPRSSRSQSQTAPPSKHPAVTRSSSWHLPKRTPQPAAQPAQTKLRQRSPHPEQPP